ncbi:thiol:disulfide interchange protein DsbA/DsbL [Novilysobacter spongiicola]|uniref:Thiol:disulfide interchange protein n=1 Tax=Lysobacter spongiicola DSM 21749 TaxID=1122188 RepID=A0A1T4RJY7_9GAMM|nr:thiol:disulfide interchange protein DsbA/DsbL [Lysobacter spongiicola]SKA16302.1 thiol:disulfide interchange protein DsbA [Lysobacter spongiicola DSM 21749]
MTSHAAARPSRRTSLLARLSMFAALVLMPIVAFSAELVAGEDYVEIPGGAPFSTGAGKVEVADVFGYTCPHCANFEPALSAWRKRLPRDVEVVSVPAPFGGYWMPYARAYYAAQSLGLAERTHSAVFRALHQDRSLPISGATPAEISTFYAGHGADPEAFASAMASPEVEEKLQEARDFLRRSGVEGTPALVVAGKYRVLGNSASEILENARALVERERARK